MWRGRRRFGGWADLDTALESHFNLIASYVALAIECGAVFVVAFGAIQAMAGLLKVIANGQAGELEGRQIWLRFATWILLALEFALALAADILRTAVAPTWDDISKLAVIAHVCSTISWPRTSPSSSMRACPAEISPRTSPPPNRLDRRGMIRLSESGPPQSNLNRRFRGRIRQSAGF